MILIYVIFESTAVIFESTAFHWFLQLIQGAKLLLIKVGLAIHVEIAGQTDHICLITLTSIPLSLATNLDICSLRISQIRCQIQMYFAHILILLKTWEKI